MRKEIAAGLLVLMVVACGDDGGDEASAGGAGMSGASGQGGAAGQAGAGGAQAGMAGAGGEAGAGGSAAGAGGGGVGGAAGGAGAGSGGQGGGTGELCEFSKELKGGGTACAVKPSATNLQISDDFGYHALGVPAALGAETPVYLHLVGSGGEPAKPATSGFSNEQILQEMTEKGYLVLMLAYPNEPPVGALCQSDLACYEQVRREIIDGTPAAAPYDKLNDVSSPQDIVSRFGALVAHLQKQPSLKSLPASLAGAKPDTAKIRIGGHSQGGGHAGLLAKDLVFERVCMLSAPIDNNAQASGHVPWVDGAWATPLASRRAIIHEQDKSFDKAKANLDAMGLVEQTHWKRLTGATTEAHGYTAKGEADEAVEARRFCMHDP